MESGVSHYFLVASPAPSLVAHVAISPSTGFTGAQIAAHFVNGIIYIYIDCNKMKWLVCFILSLHLVAATMKWDFVNIRRKLADGEIVQIRDALPVHLLQFNYTNVTWKENSGIHSFGKVWYTRKRCKQCANPIEDWVMNHIAFFQMLVPYKNISGVDLDMTKYSDGDYLDLHTDYNNVDRSLAFVLHLNSVHPACGGEFVWAAEKGIKIAPPKENTLYMFVPSRHSWHGIQKVQCEHRYAISGWLQ